MSAPDSPPRKKLSEAELEQLRAAVLERAKHMSEEDLRVLLADEPRAERKAEALRSRLPGMVRHVHIGFSLVRDYFRGDYRKLPWWSIASVAAALGYFVTPTDLMPDFLPFIGYVDDAAVLAAVMQSIKQDLKRYCEAKGIKLDD
jgi:uncharacterized membrane protein YkvA (DUF1232 family)